MWLTSPVEGDGGGDDGDPSQDGDDGQDHGVAAQTTSSVDVALLQTVSGLNTVKRRFILQLISTRTFGYLNSHNRKWQNVLVW